MTRNFIFILLFCCYTIAFSQTIENPAFGRSDIPSFYIKSVEITKDTTYVSCLYYAEAGSWASISKEIYLRDTKSHKTFLLQRSEGLPYSPKIRQFTQNESCELIFCFPSISGIENFDFIESEGERAFNIYGVSLKNKHRMSYTDTDLNRISEIISTYKSTGDKEITITELSQVNDYSSRCV